MHSLFINPITSMIWLHVIDTNHHEVILKKNIPIGNDFDAFPETILDLLQQYSIGEIWCILWPGMFTRMRIIILTLNTIQRTSSRIIKGIHFFDLLPWDKQGILQANNGEYLIRKQDGEVELIPTICIPPGNYIGYGEKNDFTDDKVFIEYTENYSHICTLFSQIEPSTQLTPVYLKAPNITTWSKKNTSPFWKKTNKSS